MKAHQMVIFVVAVLFLTLGGAAQQPGPPAAITVIEGATVIDGVSSQPIRDAILVIDGDTIRSIGRRGSVTVPAGARTIRASGKTIMPALFALHTHLAMSEQWERNKELYTRERLQRDANMYLYYGVEHAVSMGGDWEPMWGFRADQRAGRAGGARVYSAGLGYSAVGGFEPMVPPRESRASGYPRGVQGVNRPANPEEARAMVRKEMVNKPDVQKIWLDGGQNGQFKKLDPEIYGAIIDEAHKYNVKVFVHNRGLEDAKELIRRGVDVLAHPVSDKEVDEEFLQLAKDKRVAQILTSAGGYNAAFDEKASYLNDPGVPLLFFPIVLKALRSGKYQEERTAGVQAARDRFETAARSTRKIFAKGIPIVIGTDSGSNAAFAGLWEHLEMQAMVKAGLTPMQAIQAGTLNSARVLGVEKRYGSLEANKVADFIILTADPLSDIGNSRKIEAVWMNGKSVDRAMLAPRRASSD